MRMNFKRMNHQTSLIVVCNQPSSTNRTLLHFWRHIFEFEFSIFCRNLKNCRPWATVRGRSRLWWCPGSGRLTTSCNRNIKSISSNNNNNKRNRRRRDGAKKKRKCKLVWLNERKRLDVSKRSSEIWPRNSNKNNITTARWATTTTTTIFWILLFSFCLVFLGNWTRPTKFIIPLTATVCPLNGYNLAHFPFVD